MTREYTYQDLFEGEKFALDSALRDGIDYEAFQRLRMLLVLSHSQINKLEARIAELERMHSFSNNIQEFTREHLNFPVTVDQHEDLFKRALTADRDLRRANAEATMNKILGREEPIEGMVEREIKHDMEVVFSGKPINELSDSQKELRKLLLKTWVTAEPLNELTKTGYIPDDFRG